METIGATVMRDEGIMPSQWAERYRRETPFLPERRLFAAAFESALSDCLAYLPKGKMMTIRTKALRRLDALAWLNSDDTGLLTFRWYCDALGLEAAAVRARVSSGAIETQRRSKVWSEDAQIGTGCRADPKVYYQKYREKNREHLREYNRKWHQRARA